MSSGSDWNSAPLPGVGLKSQLERKHNCECVISAVDSAEQARRSDRVWLSRLRKGKVSVLILWEGVKNGAASQLSHPGCRGGVQKPSPVKLENAWGEPSYLFWSAMPVIHPPFSRDFWVFISLFLAETLNLCPIKIKEGENKARRVFPKTACANESLISYWKWTQGELWSRSKWNSWLLWYCTLFPVCFIQVLFKK